MGRSLPRNPAALLGIGLLAEGERFELSRDETAPNGFRDRRIRPLCHPSEAEKEGFEPSKEEISPLTP